MRHFTDALFEDMALEAITLNEDFKTKNLLILGDPPKDLLELLSNYRSEFKTPVRRDNCYYINYQLYNFLKEKGYNVKQVRGFFKVDNFNYLDARDFNKNERSIIRNQYGDTLKPNLIDYVNNLPDSKKVEYYFIFHGWVELDGVILDAAYRMFNKYVESTITKENYIKFSDAYKYLDSYNDIPAGKLNDVFGIKN